MDPFTHFLITRRFVSPDPAIVAAGLAAGIIRLVSGRWPLGALAWGLHILIDLPAHSRRHWAPQFLWPLSPVTVDGISWPDLVIPVLHKIFDWLTGGDR